MTKQNNTIFWIIGIVILIFIILPKLQVQEQEEFATLKVHYYDKDMNEIDYPPQKKTIDSKNFLKDLFSSISSLIGQFAIVSYTTQCSLPSCPSGYSQTNVYCEDTLNTCYRDCQRTIPGYCGSYGSYERYDKETDYAYYLDNIDTKDFDMNSNYCYKFIGSTFFCITDGSGDGYWQEAILRGSGYTCDVEYEYYFNLRASDQCSGLDTNECVWGRGVSGEYVQARGDIGSFDVWSFISMSMTVELLVSKAPWIEGYTESTTTTCTYQCDSDAECGTDNWVGTTYCSGKDVYQTWRDYYCSGGSCNYTDSSELVEICSSGYTCESGVCIQSIEYISFEVTATNTGNVSLDVIITNATPIEFLNALNITDIRTINKGQSTIWNSELIEVKSGWKGTTQIFTVFGEGYYIDTGQTKTESGSIELTL